MKICKYWCRKVLPPSLNVRFSFESKFKLIKTNPHQFSVNVHPGRPATCTGGWKKSPVSSRKPISRVDNTNAPEAEKRPTSTSKLGGTRKLPSGKVNDADGRSCAAR